MPTDDQILRTYPVVFFSQTAPHSGWYYRGPNRDVYQGPFEDRAAAIEYALQAMASDSAGLDGPSKLAA